MSEAGRLEPSGMVVGAADPMPATSRVAEGGDEHTPHGRRATLDVAVVTATALTLTSGVVLFGRPLDAGRLEAFLVALACACLAGLTVRRAPSVAWLTAIAAGYAASSLVFAEARSLVPSDVDLGRWSAVAVAASVSAITTAAIAGRYATRPTVRLDPVAVPLSVGLLGWLVIACVATIGVVLTGQRTPDPAFNWIDVATVPTSFFVPLLVLLVSLGVGADVRAARDRARIRLAPSSRTGPEHAWILAMATGRELMPGQAATTAAAEEAERTRLAGDLHAVVLPALRRAIAEAERGADPESVARHLRTVDLELERLMADRWPVVLEAFGIVAALEDLAERLEADGAPPITIDVERNGDRPAPPVERAAWRFAQVALDNAIRHAAPTSIMLVVAVEPDRVQVSVTDDGSGFDPVAAARPGARGLADSVRRAADVGALVRVGPGRVAGTEASFSWQAPSRS